MSISFQPISSAGGAEVFGVNLQKDLLESDKRLLKNECFKHSFLLFRNQEISLSEQIAFGEIFGQILDNQSFKKNVGSFVTSEGEIMPHFDHWLISRNPQPLQFTMLYALKVTPFGGETVFYNVQKVYEKLPTELKLKIQNLESLHCYDYSYEKSKQLPKRIQLSEISEDQPRAIYPIKRIHPYTGKDTLYISPRNTDQIIGLESKDSEQIMNLLFKYIFELENIYEHMWHPKDLIIWDNNALLHGRNDFDPAFERRLRRMCIL